MPEKLGYLGDSVYIEIADNGMLKLTTNNGEGPTNTIYLEEAVLFALLDYLSESGIGVIHSWQPRDPA